MIEKNIRVYHTHIEIYPYFEGENERLERYLSIWIDAEFRYDPMGYFIHNNILYVPRGVSIDFLEKTFNTHAFVVHAPDVYKTTSGVHMKIEPRDEMQIEAIKFLSAEKEYMSAGQYSQQALILGTGVGKTYTTINSIIKLHMRALIITHQTKIKKQWIECFKSYTDISDCRLVDIDGSRVMDDIMKGKTIGYYYFINHQTISSYIKSNGPESLIKFFKKLNIGIKVFDEAHLEFRSVLKIDFLSNTKKTFYLTANFSRSDEKEARLFKRVFNSVYKLDENDIEKNILKRTSNINEEETLKRKHIIFIPVMYRSNPNINHFKMATNMYGFSVLGFFKYAFHLDPDKCMMNAFRKVFDMAIQLKGKILITLPRIDDTYLLKEIIHREYPELNKTIATINSKNSKDDNDYAKEKADIIISTIKSCGTGVDIKGLRVIINMEPFSSSITANQLSGRLREFSETDDTFFFHLVDKSFPICMRQYSNVLKELNKKVKAVQILDV